MAISDKSQTTKNRGAKAETQERRAYPRYPFSASAEAVHLQVDTRLSGRVSDLGRSGCYVDTLNPFPVGAEVNIRIVKDNASFVAQGQVLYATSGMGMGLAFTKIEPERLRVLEEWIRKLSGESLQALKVAEGAAQVAPGTASAGNEPRNVLNELIVTLIRKQILTEAEGKAMLTKLMG